MSETTPTIPETHETQDKKKTNKTKYTFSQEGVKDLLNALRDSEKQCSLSKRARDYICQTVETHLQEHLDNYEFLDGQEPLPESKFVEYMTKFICLPVSYHHLIPQFKVQEKVPRLEFIYRAAKQFITKKVDSFPIQASKKFTSHNGRGMDDYIDVVGKYIFAEMFDLLCQYERRCITINKRSIRKFTELKSKTTVSPTHTTEKTKRIKYDDMTEEQKKEFDEQKKLKDEEEIKNIYKCFQDDTYRFKEDVYTAKIKQALTILEIPKEKKPPKEKGTVPTEESKEELKEEESVPVPPTPAAPVEPVSKTRRRVVKK